jgi:hypothetical protein
VGPPGEVLVPALFVVDGSFTLKCGETWMRHPQSGQSSTAPNRPFSFNFAKVPLAIPEADASAVLAHASAEVQKLVASSA